MIAALVLAIIGMGVVIVAMATYIIRTRRRPAAPPPAHYQQGIREIREIRSAMEAAERRAKERTARIVPTDEERIERIRLEVQVRTRDHAP